MIRLSRESAGLAPAEMSLCTVLDSEAERDPSATGPQSLTEPGGSAGQGAGPAAGPGAGAGGSARRLSLEAVARKLSTVSGEAEVVTTLMSYLKEEFDRAGFLSLRRGAALGVQAVADRREIPGFTGCRIELENATLLKKVLEERAPYIGKFPERGAEEHLLKSIGGKPGAPALLLPLEIGGQAVAFLIVEDDSGRLGPGVSDLRRVASKAELAFEMLSIRKKIGLV